MKKCVALCLILIMGVYFMAIPVGAISEKQKAAIVENCEMMKDSLKAVQRLDAKARGFFGSRFETVITKFATALNVRLVENGLSEPNLIDNQNALVAAKANFRDNYVGYQQSLETLVGMDCRTEPERFYTQLGHTRIMRNRVSEDIVKLKKLTMQNIELAKGMKVRL